MMGLIAGSFLSTSFFVVVIAIGFGLLAPQHHHLPPSFSTKACSSSSSSETFTFELPLQIHNNKNNQDKDSVLLSIDPCHLYSETYREARDKFRRAATTAGAEWHTLTVPVPTELSRVLDDDNDNNNNKEEKEGYYTIDIAVLHGNGPGLMVHTSGVHGVEGYAGSPIQIAFLESIYPFWKEQQQQQQQDDYQSKTGNQQMRRLPTIVLVHAVNPFGMAHYRRTNENNVDLNRNGIHPDEWDRVITAIDSVLVPGKRSPYEAYSKLNHWFNPPGPPTRWNAMVEFWYLLIARGLMQVVKALRGQPYLDYYDVKTAMVTGQYYDSKGIFHGGQELQPSLQMLYQFFDETLLLSADNDNNNNSEQHQQHKEEEEPGGETREDGMEHQEVAAAEQEATTTTNSSSTTSSSSRCCTGTVTWIDVHTGLGPSGQDTLLPSGCRGDSEDPHTHFVQEQSEMWFPGGRIPWASSSASSKAAQDVRNGYDNVMGQTGPFFQRLFLKYNNNNNNEGGEKQRQQQHETYLSLTQEFGTVPGTMVAHALVVENRAFQHLPPAQALEWAKQTTKRAFYKQTPEWRRQILDRGLTVMVQAVHRSASDNIIHHQNEQQ